MWCTQIANRKELLSKLEANQSFELRKLMYPAWRYTILVWIWADCGLRCPTGCEIWVGSWRVAATATRIKYQDQHQSFILTPLLVSQKQLSSFKNLQFITMWSWKGKWNNKCIKYVWVDPIATINSSFSSSWENCKLFGETARKLLSGLVQEPASKMAKARAPFAQCKLRLQQGRFWASVQRTDAALPRGLPGWLRLPLL